MAKKKEGYYIIEKILFPGWVKQYGFFTSCIGLARNHWDLKIQIAQRNSEGRKLFPGTYITEGLEIDQFPVCHLWKGVPVHIVPIRMLKKTKGSPVKKPKKELIKPMSLSEWEKRDFERRKRELEEAYKLD